MSFLTALDDTNAYHSNMSTHHTPDNAVHLATPEKLRRSARSRMKGRQPEAQALAEVQTLIGKRPVEGHRRDWLIEHLHVLNDHYRALFERHLVALAFEMNLSLAEVYEVATFYHHFHVLPDDATAPEITVRVCDSLSCKLGGAEELLARLEPLMGDSVKVLRAPCVGRCDQAPVAVVHQNPVAHATPEKVQQAVLKKETQDVWRHPELVCFEAYQAQGGYALVRDGQLLQAAQAAQTLQTLEASGLRGLGGAGFPLGRKWRIVREQTAPRLMAVNIDEGEPGTFKDRHYLERDPHRFLEGMLIAAQVVGINAIYIYLRDEYHACRALLQQALQDLKARPPCALPHIELRRGAGAYICGEESAMIESIEGKRGEPRLRPPYIAQVGLFGRPTLEHNFESLYWVRDILQRGADAFTSAGRHGRQGWRSFSVSGRVKNPGVKLAPAGITLQELIDEHCGGMLDGHTLYAYLPGGASGGILPARLANVPLDFDTLQSHGCFIGSAAVMVLSQHDSARDTALNVMQFFADESCGQCTPCRVGTDKAAQLMQSAQWAAETLEDLAQVMGDASICGLGQAAPNPIRCVLQYFPHEVGADKQDVNVATPKANP